MITEEFIHFLWKFRMLKPELRTTTGDLLEIVHPGDHNTDSGPDFFNARIRIGGTLWAGNVEMHVLASDWDRHGHSSDRAYDNTILHVVHTADASIRLPGGDPIPMLEVAGRYPPDILSRYDELMQNRLWIPCYRMLSSSLIPDFGFWAPSLAVERLLDKSYRIRELLKFNQGDWEETFYQWLARGFGFRINAFPFELLARSLPLKVLNRYRGNRLQVEALLFGQAGLTNDTTGIDYPKRLRIEYGFLQAKHALEPLPQGIWKFLRLRPSNFPTLRLSQFGNLITGRDFLLPFILKCPDPAEMEEWLDIRAASFWNDHYTFDRISPASEKKLGASSARLLTMNAVAPFLFYYGLEKDSNRFREHAVRLLESLPAEENLDIRRWHEAGMKAENALLSQALLQLKTGYCDRRKCLACRIGRQLLDHKNRLS